MLTRRASGAAILAASSLRGVPCAAWSRGLAAKTAQGFSSPGNTGISEEMKEAGRPDEVWRNEEATQRHLYSEKDRFDSSRYENPQAADSPFGKAFAEGGDTGPARAVSEATGRTASPSQSLGINVIPERLAYTKADDSIPEAPRGTAGAKPGEISPDRSAGKMGPGAGMDERFDHDEFMPDSDVEGGKPGLWRPAGADLHGRFQGRSGGGPREAGAGVDERFDHDEFMPESDVEGGEGRRPEDAGAEGESEDIIEELHKGGEWAE